MNSNKIVSISLLLLTIASVFIFFTGSSVTSSEQIRIIKSLQTTSTIIFGIFGAWIAIISPKSFLINAPTPRTISEEEQKVEQDTFGLIKKLKKPFLWNLIILIYTLLFEISLPIARTFSFSFDVIAVFRSLSYTFIFVLFLIQVITIAYVVFPLALIEINHKKQRKLDEKFKHLKGKKR